MLVDLEQRLAQVLGQRLPAPFMGRVTVAPDSPPGPGPELRVAVGSATPLDPDFGARRSELTPGTPLPRRVARLRCEIVLTVDASAPGGRAEQVEGVDALLYLLDAPDFRNADALTAPGDPGFLLSELRVVSADLSPTLANDSPAVLVLRAEGWFWPVGEVGAAGPAIAEAHLRQLVLPVNMVPAEVRFVAGGGPVDLRFEVGAAGTAVVSQGGVVTAAFGRIAASLEGPGGTPGAGTLGGGQAGIGGARLIAVTDNSATITYTPPAAPASDRLILRSVTRNAGETHFGPQLAAFDLIVAAAP